MFYNTFKQTLNADARRGLGSAKVDKLSGFTRALPICIAGLSGPNFLKLPETELWFPRRSTPTGVERLRLKLGVVRPSGPKVVAWGKAKVFNFKRKNRDYAMPRFRGICCFGYSTSFQATFGTYIIPPPPPPSSSNN